MHTESELKALTKPELCDILKALAPDLWMESMGHLAKRDIIALILKIEAESKATTTRGIRVKTLAGAFLNGLKSVKKEV